MAPGERSPELRRTAAGIAGFDELIEAVALRLPPDWVASLQLEDPLTRTLEQVATSDPRARTELLTLAPLAEVLTQAGDPWLMRQLGLAQARVFAFPGERPCGRLLLVAGAGAARLDERRAVELRALVAEAGPVLERARARREDGKLSGRLRRVAEAELAEHFTRVSLGLLPSARAVAVLVADALRLTVIRVRCEDGASLEEYLRRTVPFEGSHLAALAGTPQDGVAAVLRPSEAARYTEGRLFAALVDRLRPGCVETVPLEPGGRLAGSLLIFHRNRERPEEERAATSHLAGALALAFDRIRPQRLLEDLRQERGRQVLRRQRRTFGFHPSVQADDVEYHFGNLVGDPQGAFGQVYRFIERVAGREDETVLILGETGCGKDMIAHAIHNASPRRSRPLQATNFAALGGDPNLIQSELFGHEKGAFTGAVRRRRGAFEQAHRSTLLIDELGDIVPSVQVKLLRVLDPTSRREFTRLGGEDLIGSDVRVLAATNKDLKREMLTGNFREDLYYRLSALMVRVPPLRARREDIPLLVQHFLVRLGKGQPVRLRRGVFDQLQSYAWPGNVRQLESVLLRALVMFGAPDELSAEDVRQALAIEEEWEHGAEVAVGAGDVVRLECPHPPPPNWFWDQVQEPWKTRRLPAAAVRRLLAHHLEETGGYYTQVAERLGVERRDYQRFLDFLKHAGLKVDHRPYRVRRDDGG